MCLCSGVEPSVDLSGAPYVQASLKACFGEVGPTFMVVALAMFAFSTLLGNFFFIENCFTYINKKPLSKSALTTVRVVGAIIIGIGATLSAGTVWDLADFLNVIMAFINMPVCMLIGGIAYKCLDDYRQKRKTSDKVRFHASDIGLDPSKLDFWNE
jgi:AGCS family alanine or glycine:cation symporter